jgi:hypothetical protein
MTAAGDLAATAGIKTGRRKIASYLLSPVDEARLEPGANDEHCHQVHPATPRWRQSVEEQHRRSRVGGPGKS